MKMAIFLIKMDPNIDQKNSSIEVLFTIFLSSSSEVLRVPVKYCETDRIEQKSFKVTIFTIFIQIKSTFWP